ncbi:alanine racemase [Jiangella rhizosphaerae]|uniref:YhfX family PLP-dependent enzyme n=1 Tax=Jiangella rhizosphaerae TaxID=2293569 RepID=A0A418KQP8_9ACTN|nr:alanine racemase [Jiangella rhizosphaerae]RIQ23123.1 YhfX family PLP-dependent enzyme [Jiangella rhizosphaerae]
MFLAMTERRNPALIEAAIELHRSGAVEPDTYVIDLDAVDHNAAALAATAGRHGVRLWFVAKQYGRNPLVTAAVARHIPSAAAIDHREATALLDAGARLGNIGHLVQVPRRRLPALLAERPAYATVADRQNLEAVAAAAHGAGRVQPVLLKIRGAAESTFPGQDGGFEPDEVAGVLEDAARLDGVRVAGATGFPCLSFDPSAGRPRPTGTLDRVLAAAATLRAAGLDPVLSLPSHTSVSTIPQIARLGGTVGEPGHALTGTTPEHAVDAGLTERPALVYVSEIAQLGSAPSIFGGGFYSRGRARGLLVATRGGPRRATLHDAPGGSIDYYRRFDWVADGDGARVGDTAVMAFRTQIFVTRSRVAVVSGIASGRPRLEGVFDALGRPVR